MNKEDLRKLIKNVGSQLYELLSNVVCSICQELLTKPVITPCGHSFCSRCIKKVLSSKDNSGCPLCKNPMKRYGLEEDKVKLTLSKICEELPTAFAEDVKELTANLKDFGEDVIKSSKLLQFKQESPKDKEKKSLTRKSSRRTLKNISKEQKSDSGSFIPVLKYSENIQEYASAKRKKMDDLVSVSQTEPASSSSIGEPTELDKKLQKIEKIPPEEKVKEWFNAVGDNIYINSPVSESDKKEINRLTVGKQACTKVDNKTDPYEFIPSQRTRKRCKRTHGRAVKKIPDFQALQSFSKENIKRTKIVQECVEELEERSQSPVKVNRITASQKFDQLLSETKNKPHALYSASRSSSPNFLDVSLHSKLEEKKRPSNEYELDDILFKDIAMVEERGKRGRAGPPAKRRKKSFGWKKKQTRLGELLHELVNDDIIYGTQPADKPVRLQHTSDEGMYTPVKIEKTQKLDTATQKTALIGFDVQEASLDEVMFKQMVENMERELNSNVTEKNVQKPNRESFVAFNLLGKIRQSQSTFIEFLQLGKLTPTRTRSRSTVVKVVFPIGLASLARRLRRTNMREISNGVQTSQRMVSSIAQTSEVERLSANIQTSQEVKPSIEIQTSQKYTTTVEVQTTQREKSREVQTSQIGCSAQMQTSQIGCSAQMQTSQIGCSAQMQTSQIGCSAQMQTSQIGCSAQIQTTLRRQSCEIQTSQIGLSAEVPTSQIGCSSQIQKTQRRQSCEVQTAQIGLSAEVQTTQMEIQNVIRSTPRKPAHVHRKIIAQDTTPDRLFLNDEEIYCEMEFDSTWQKTIKSEVKIKDDNEDSDIRVPKPITRVLSAESISPAKVIETYETRQKIPLDVRKIDRDEVMEMIDLRTPKESEASQNSEEQMLRVLKNINLDLPKCNKDDAKGEKSEESDSDFFVEQTPPRTKQTIEDLLKTREKNTESADVINDSLPKGFSESFLLLTAPDKPDENDQNQLNANHEVEAKTAQLKAVVEAWKQSETKTKKRFCVVASSIKNPELIRKFTTKFKIEYSSKPTKDMTHLIVGLHKNEEKEELPLCTPKLLFAMANKKWVVSEFWAESCLKMNVILPEENFETLDPVGGCGCKKARMSSEKLLRNCEIYLLGCFQTISIEEFADLIIDCGGAVVSSPEKFSYLPSRLRMIIADHDCLKMDEAQIQELFEKHSTVVLSRDFIIMSIQSYTLSNFTSYLLHSASEKVLVKLGYPLTLVRSENDEDE